MLIGIDGNEANVKNRVGSGIYTHELLKQFNSISLRGGKRRANNVTPHPKHVSGSVPRFTIYLKDKPLADLPGETENFKFCIFGPKKFWTQFALPIKLTFGKKPDVFFSPAHYGPRFSKVPYIVTIHDLSYLHFPQLFRKEDLLQLTNWSKYSIKNSTAIITPSKSTKDDIAKNYQVPPSKITVTYEGYNKEAFKPQLAAKISAVKKKYKIKGDYLIFVGTLQPRKNIERLIDAFSILARDTLGTHDTFDTLSLVIAGKKGWLYDQILTKSKELGIEEKVIFTDFVPDEDLPALLSGARIYVNPSLWEGFGIPVIEAQACGVPVVVSNTSSLPEIVSSSGVGPQSEGRGPHGAVYPERSKGSSAILVDPTSVESISAGIKKILTDEKLRQNLVKKGFENTKRFSWDLCAKQTLQVLTEVASK